MINIFKVKKIVIVVVAFMCVALVLSLLMRSFGSAGVVEEPEDEEKDITVEEIVCTSHVDKDDDELCDVCGVAYSDGICNHIDVDDDRVCDLCEVSYSDGLESVENGTAHNVNHISGYDFDFPHLYIPGFVTYGLYDRDGVSFSLDEKMTYKGVGDAGSTERFFGFSAEKDDVYKNRIGLDFADAHYITVDFDMTTEDRYPFEFYIRPVFSTSDHVNTSKTGKMLYFNSDGTDLSVRATEDSEWQKVSNTLHITYVINTERYLFYVYLNGEYFCTYENVINDAQYLDSIKIFIPSGSVPENGESISIDNVAVYTFGDGNYKYFGPLYEMVNDKTIKLQDCEDSVLYEGEKQ